MKAIKKSGMFLSVLRHASICCGVLVPIAIVVASVNADEPRSSKPSEKKTVVAFYSALDETLEILSKISTIESAKAALPKLSDVREKYKWAKVFEEYCAMPRERQFNWRRGLEPRSDATNRRCDSEFERLRRIEGALGVLRDCAVVEYEDWLNKKLVQLVIRQDIEEAMNKYHKLNGAYPRQLAELCTAKEPGKDAPLLDSKWLIDPWGREILFDPSGKKNRSSKPDVWSKGPPYRTGDEWVIGNWSPGTQK